MHLTEKVYLNESINCNNYLSLSYLIEIGSLKHDLQLVYQNIKFKYILSNIGIVVFTS